MRLSNCTCRSWMIRIRRWRLGSRWLHNRLNHWLGCRNGCWRRSWSRGDMRCWDRSWRCYYRSHWCRSLWRCCRLGINSWLVLDSRWWRSKDFFGGVCGLGDSAWGRVGDGLAALLRENWRQLLQIAVRTGRRVCYSSWLNSSLTVYSNIFGSNKHTLRTGLAWRSDGRWKHYGRRSSLYFVGGNWRNRSWSWLSRVPVDALGRRS